MNGDRSVEDIRAYFVPLRVRNALLFFPLILITLHYPTLPLE